MKKDTYPRLTIIRAQNGWAVLRLHIDEAGEPHFDDWEPVIAWAIEKGVRENSDPHADPVFDCTVDPITLSEGREDAHDRWMKRPDGRFSLAGLEDCDTAAEAVARAVREYKRKRDALPVSQPPVAPSAPAHQEQGGGTGGAGGAGLTPAIGTGTGLVQAIGSGGAGGKRDAPPVMSQPPPAAPVPPVPPAQPAAVPSPAPVTPAADPAGKKPKP